MDTIIAYSSCKTFTVPGVLSFPKDNLLKSPGMSFILKITNAMTDDAVTETLPQLDLAAAAVAVSAAELITRTFHP